MPFFLPWHRGRWVGELAFVSVFATACHPRGGAHQPGDGQALGEAIAFTSTTMATRAAAPSPLLELLQQTAALHLQRLQTPTVEEPAYFIAYDVADVQSIVLQAQRGALIADEVEHERAVDVDVRVGSPTLDNSHLGGGSDGSAGIGSATILPLGDDSLAIRQALWQATESQYRDAKDALQAIEDDERVRIVQAGKEHPDFSREGAVTYVRAPIAVDFSALRLAWQERVRAASEVLAGIDPRADAHVRLSGELKHRYAVNTEGSKIQDAHFYLRLSLEISLQADDGMVLSRTRIFDAATPEDLPNDGAVRAAIAELGAQLLALKSAPLADPYTGPAVLEGMAAGVFFHEIFGHRLEGQRQKKDDEGQTFVDMLGQSVLPSFIDVTDDPTLARLNDTALNGAYLIDDEAVIARPVSLVSRGILRNFLLSRSPVLPFHHSNGHGRRDVGYPLAARQGNLLVNSRRTLDDAALRRALLGEIRRQGKPYGLRFAEINGGYTTTDRGGPQAFKVEPTMVYRVWADGRPDELVRGADLVGTPLAAFATILATGDRLAIFNGFCGAESGWVPVSAISPALLLSQIEVERSQHDRERPPLLTPPQPPRPLARAHLPVNQQPSDAHGAKP